MESHRPSDSSLQQVLRSSPVAPELLQVKPRGLKGILKTLLDFLESHQIQATMVAKLPRGKAWKEDIDRYQATAPESECYCLARHPESNDSATDEPTAITLVPMRSQQSWRGDYFVIILATEISFLMTAQRLKTSTAASAEGEAATPTPTSSKTYLDVAISINPSLIADVLRAVTGLISDAHAPLQEVLESWQGQLRTQLAWSPTVLDQWLVWQFKIQEHLRQAAHAYRSQALSAANLASQNEVLINNLRLKDDFLNTVGQELRTPLTTIKTALTLLGSPNLKAPQRDRYMAMITQECDRQSALIQGVLNLLQIETSFGETRPDPIKIGTVVPAVVSTYQPLAAEKGIDLSCTMPDHLPDITCPESWLRQIMIHLLSNSIRFTHRGGKVSVSAHQDTATVDIVVRDTGVGIHPGEISTIFDHFFKGRNLPSGEIEGAGLGLSIVRQLLLYCGGSIKVDSQLHQGSTFHIQLPVHRS
ncbi:hypothetical protein C7271_09315 [filamentous cyanobacterium CCP5]|nr:hypothetical protein C7271_09315 [filamentous cyanobacterium CCP5]